jgi:hypothetical protein
MFKKPAIRWFLALTLLALLVGLVPAGPTMADAPSHEYQKGQTATLDPSWVCLTDLVVLAPQGEKPLSVGQPMAIGFYGPTNIRFDYGGWCFQVGLGGLDKLAKEKEINNRMIYFPQTGQSLKNAFLDYWRSHDGERQLGFPYKPEEKRTLPGTGDKVFTVQFTQKSVMQINADRSPTDDFYVQVPNFGVSMWDMLNSQSGGGNNPQTEGECIVRKADGTVLSHTDHEFAGGQIYIIGGGCRVGGDTFVWPTEVKFDGAGHPTTAVPAFNDPAWRWMGLPPLQKPESLTYIGNVVTVESGNWYWRAGPDWGADAGHNTVCWIVTDILKNGCGPEKGGCNGELTLVWPLHRP